VLPAFFCEGDPENFPRTKQDLVERAKTRACHQIHDDPGFSICFCWHNFCLIFIIGRAIAHRNTNYTHYLTAVKPYPALYSFPFEPYLIVDKTDLPRYDARFAGYGNDKAVQTYEMNWRGFKFLVMPDSFVIHIEHDAGPWR
jgi:hypothetical protein